MRRRGRLMGRIQAAIERVKRESKEKISRGGQPRRVQPRFNGARLLRIEEEPKEERKGKDRSTTN